MDPIIKQIKEKHPGKLVGVLGSTSPGDGYAPIMGVSLGCWLAKEADHTNMSVFTGGVEGVGVDVYTGFMLECIRRPELTSRSAFFVLIPGTVKRLFSDRKSESVKYQLPYAYQYTGGLLAGAGEPDLSVYQAGATMDARRVLMAQAGDAYIALNGSHGTLDEIQMALARGKPTILVESSGGAAALLAMAKLRGWDSVRQSLHRATGFKPGDFDLDLIKVASDSLDAILKLKDLFKENK